MQFSKVGKSGLKVSRLSLGTWVSMGEKSNEDESRDMIRLAYERGVNFLDTADKYADGEAEIVLGKIIKDFPREAFVLASKVWAPTMEGPNGRGLSRKHILESCHASLKRLQTDYLDIYYCHSFDATTPLEETIRAMNDLVNQGKVLYWGTSNWRASQIARGIGLAERFRGYKPVVEQPQYNMFVRRKVETELAPVAEELGVGLVTYSPLRFGLLTGKYLNNTPPDSRIEYRDWLRPILTDEDSLHKVGKLGKVAEEIEASLAQFAIAWLLRLPEITSVIIGASKPSQLEENLGALEILPKLDECVLEKVEDILSNAPELLE